MAWNASIEIFEPIGMMNVPWSRALDVSFAPLTGFQKFARKKRTKIENRKNCRLLRGGCGGWSSFFTYFNLFAPVIHFLYESNDWSVASFRALNESLSTVINLSISDHARFLSVWKSWLFHQKCLLSIADCLLRFWSAIQFLQTRFKCPGFLE